MADVKDFTAVDRALQKIRLFRAMLEADLRG